MIISVLCQCQYRGSFIIITTHHAQSRSSTEPLMVAPSYTSTSTSSNLHCQRRSCFWGLGFGRCHVLYVIRCSCDWLVAEHSLGSSTHNAHQMGVQQHAQNPFLSPLDTTAATAPQPQPQCSNGALYFSWAASASASASACCCWWMRMRMKFMMVSRFLRF